MTNLYKGQEFNCHTGGLRQEEEQSKEATPNLYASISIDRDV